MKIATDAISTREDFLVFMRSLSDELESGSNNWSNSSLESFLAAMTAWIEDMDGYYENKGILKDVNLSSMNWRVMADILMAARIYE